MDARIKRDESLSKLGQGVGIFVNLIYNEEVKIDGYVFFYCSVIACLLSLSWDLD